MNWKFWQKDDRTPEQKATDKAAQKVADRKEADEERAQKREKFESARKKEADKQKKELRLKSRRARGKRIIGTQSSERAAQEAVDKDKKKKAAVKPPTPEEEAKKLKEQQDREALAAREKEEADRKEAELEERVEQLKRSRKLARNTTDEDFQEKLNAALIRRRVIKAEYDRQVEKVGAKRKGHFRKVNRRKRELDKIDEDIRRLLDSIRILDRGPTTDIGDMKPAEFREIVRESDEVEDLDKGKVKKAIDHSIMGGMGMHDDEGKVHRADKKELKKVKEAVREGTKNQEAEVIDDKSLDDFKEGLGVKLTELDSDPGVAALIAQRNVLEQQRIALKAKSFTVNKRRKLRNQIEELDKQIDAARRQAFIFKYAFSDDEAGQLAKTRYIKELAVITSYNTRIDAKSKKEKMKDPGKKATPQQRAEYEAAQKRRQQDSHENVEALTKQHEEMFTKAMAIQMGIMGPTDNLDELSKEQRKRLAETVNAIIRRSDSSGTKQLNPAELEEKVRQLQEMRSNAVTASGDNDIGKRIKELTQMITLEQVALDEMVRKESKDPASMDRKRKRIKEYQQEISRLSDAATLRQSTLTDEDKQIVDDKVTKIVQQKTGHVDSSRKKLDKRNMYNLAIKFGFIKPGESMDKATKKKVQSIIDAAEAAKQATDTQALSDAVSDDFAGIEDTPQIKALVKKHKELHEKREELKKHPATEIPQRNITVETNKLRKEILRLRRVEVAKKIARDGGDTETERKLKALELSEETVRGPGETTTSLDDKAIKEKVAKQTKDRDDLATRVIATKMGIIQPGEKLDEKKAARVEKAVYEASRKAVLDKETNVSMEKMTQLTEAHVNARIEMIVMIENNEHGDDPLLIQLFDAYRKAAAKRRASAIELEKKKDVDSTPSQLANKPKNWSTKRAVKAYDMQMRQILDGCLTVMRNNEINARAEAQGDTGEGPKPVKVPQPTFKSLMDEDTAKAINTQSMAVNMGYIQPGEPVPAHVKKLMKAIRKTSKLVAVDDTTMKSLGESLGEKYLALEKDDETLKALLAKQKELFDRIDAATKIEGEGKDQKVTELDSEDHSALRKQLDLLQYKIKDRRRILLVEAHGFAGDDEGLLQFKEAVKKRDQQIQKRESGVQTGSFDDIAYEYCDSIVEDMVILKMGEMLGLSAEGTTMSASNRKKLLKAIERVDKQAYIAIQTGKFKQTKAYDRLKGRIVEKELYDEVNQTSVSKDDVSFDTVLYTDSQTELKDVVDGLKVGGAVSSGLKSLPSTQSVLGGDVTDWAITEAAFTPIIGIINNVYSTMELIKAMQVNNGRGYDKAVQSLKQIASYSKVAETIVGTVGTSMNVHSGRVAEIAALKTQHAAQIAAAEGDPAKLALIEAPDLSEGTLLDEVVPGLAIATSALKVIAATMEIGKALRVKSVADDELKIFDEGYKAGAVDAVDDFELLTLISVAQKRKATYAAFDLTAGMFTGAAAVCTLSGVASPIGAALKGVATFTKIAKLITKKVVLDKKDDREVLHGIMEEEEAQELTQTPGYRMLSGKEKEKVITQSVGASSRRHFVNMLRISHAMDMKERIDKNEMTDRDKRLLRVFGFSFDDTNTDALKNISIHELATFMGYAGENWQDDFKNASDSAKLKHEKKVAKKMQGPIRERVEKSTMKGFDYGTPA